MTRRRSRATAVARAVATAMVTAVAAAVCTVALASSAVAATALHGTFTLAPGSCSGSTVTGTYLRMILPSGSVNGPYMSNSDSPCKDQTYTSLAAGTDGGLVSGSYQPTPQPPFDKNGNALAGRITAPSPFYGTSFATSSNPTDPQTRATVGVPQVYANGGVLSADLRAFSVTWNNQYFNQGSPKPDGTYPGNTRSAYGTYDATTGAFTLDWTSQVVGGPFDKFTGQWHLSGRFVPAAGASTGSGSGAQSAPGGAAAGGGAPGAAGPVQAAAHSGNVATRSGTATAANRAGAAPASGAAQTAPAQQLAASTTTTTKDRWHVSWPVIALTVALAIAGFATIAWLNRSLRSAAPR